MNVYAIDGSKYTLPATTKIRDEFDPKSGLDKDEKGYYPKCTVSTLYDVERKLPVARTVAKNDVSEREEAKKLLIHLRDKSVCLFDRGYISYDLLNYIEKELRYKHPCYYVMRCPVSSTFESLMEFMRSSKEDDIIWIKAPKKYVYYRPKEKRPSQPRHTKKSREKWCNGAVRYA
ncbi:MAG: transposase [Nitrospirae bacterium]|nr:transposase [Nitrospirota bacterium]